MAMKIILILLLFGSAAAIDFPGIIKSRHWRELVVYSLFLLSGFAVVLLQYIVKQDLSQITDWIVLIFK